MTNVPTPLLTEQVLPELAGGRVVEEGREDRHEHHMHVVQGGCCLHVCPSDVRVPTLNKRSSCTTKRRGDYVYWLIMHEICIGIHCECIETEFEIKCVIYI